VFERFAEAARQVVVLAQDEARELRHNFIGTEHLLLGLLREEEGLAGRVLASFDVTLEEVRQQVLRIVGACDEAGTGHIPFTPRAKKVLEHSLREALSLGQDSIDTEHVLLGLVREKEGVATRILLGFGADAEKLREHVLSGMAGQVAVSRATRPRLEMGYQVEEVRFDEIEMTRLDERLREGWELVGIASEGDRHRLIFKRRSI